MPNLKKVIQLNNGLVFFLIIIKKKKRKRKGRGHVSWINYTSSSTGVLEVLQPPRFCSCMLISDIFITSLSIFGSSQCTLLCFDLACLRAVVVIKIPSKSAVGRSPKQRYWTSHTVLTTLKGNQRYWSAKLDQPVQALVVPVWKSQPPERVIWGLLACMEAQREGRHAGMLRSCQQPCSDCLTW